MCEICTKRNSSGKVGILSELKPFLLCIYLLSDWVHDLWTLHHFWKMRILISLLSSLFAKNILVLSLLETASFCLGTSTVHVLTLENWGEGHFNTDAFAQWKKWQKVSFAFEVSCNSNVYIIAVRIQQVDFEISSFHE